MNSSDPSATLAGSPTPVPSPAPEPFASRFLKGLCRLGLVAAFTVLLGLAVLTVLPAITKVPGWIGLAILIIVPAVFLWLAHRRRWMTSWTAIVIGSAVVIPGYVWLMSDDAVVRRPVSVEELCPPGPQAAESWELTLAFTPHYGKPASRIYTTPKLMVARFVPEQADEWKAWVEKNAEAIRMTWDSLPERAWWTELNRYAVIGDLAPGRHDAPIMRFQPVYLFTAFGCAQASSLAVQGKGDEAIDTLLPIVEVSRKLEPAARSLARLMIARNTQKRVILTARFVLDHAQVSAGRKARLAAALSQGAGGPAMARRLVLVDYALASNYWRRGFSGMTSDQPAWWHPPVNLASRVFFNPRATVNLFGDFAVDLAGLAERRDLAALAARQNAFVDRYAHPHFKNMAGGLILGMAIPAYSAVVESYWKTEDARLALIADLAK
jgi:hypothetical protein